MGAFPKFNLGWASYITTLPELPKFGQELAQIRGKNSTNWFSKLTAFCISFPSGEMLKKKS